MRARVKELQIRLSAAEIALAERVQIDGELAQRLMAIENVLTVNGPNVCLNANGTLKLSASKGVSVNGSFAVNGGAITLTAGTVSVYAGKADFSGVVQSDAVVTNTVVATTYTPE